MNHCKKCGDPVPEGKEFCWCCSHTKLHLTEPKQEEKCSDKTCRSEVHHE